VPISRTRLIVWDPDQVNSRDRYTVPDVPRPSVRRSSPEDDVDATQAAYQAQQDELAERSRSRRPAAWLRAFAKRYGWRAYALPVLAVVTVIALLSTGGTSNKGNAGAVASASTSGPHAASSSHSAPPTAIGDQPLKTDDPGSGSLNTALQSAALPTGAAYTVQGTGQYTVLPGNGPVVGTGTPRRYSIEVENGITGIDLTAFANTVQTVLSDPRSWTAGGTALQRVDSGQIEFRVTLTSAMTVRTLCGYDIPIETSCFVPAGQNGSNVRRVALNVARWIRGDAAYIGDLDAYRDYMVNHEVGHALGHQHAHSCLASGAAPVMLQQTIGLKATDGQLCTANPWPYPPGAADAPGVEAADTPVNNEFNLQNE
jgi:hypothetical protein